MLPGSPVAAEYARGYSAGDYGAPPQHDQDDVAYGDAAPGRFRHGRCGAGYDARPFQPRDCRTLRTSPARVPLRWPRRSMIRICRASCVAPARRREGLHAPAPMPMPVAPVADPAGASPNIARPQPVRRGAPTILKAIARGKRRRLQASLRRACSSVRRPPSSRRNSPRRCCAARRGCSKMCSLISASKAKCATSSRVPVVTLYELEPRSRHEGYAHHGAGRRHRALDERDQRASP